MWFLHQEIIRKTDAYNLFLWVSLCCSFSNVCTTLEFGGILLAPVRQLSSIFLRVVTFPELSRGRGRSQNKSRLKHQPHLFLQHLSNKQSESKLIAVIVFTSNSVIGLCPRQYQVSFMKSILKQVGWLLSFLLWVSLFTLPCSQSALSILNNWGPTGCLRN